MQSYHYSVIVVLSATNCRLQRVASGFRISSAAIYRMRVDARSLTIADDRLVCAPPPIHIMTSSTGRQTGWPIHYICYG